MISDLLAVLVMVGVMALTVHLVVRLQQRKKAPLEAAPRVWPSPGFDAFLREAYEAVASARAGFALGELSYTGALHNGRKVRIVFAGTEKSTQVRLCVSTARDVPDLRVRPDDPLEALRGDAKAEDIQTGDRAFDERFFLQSTEPREGARALGVATRKAITQAFSRAGVERLVLKPGELSLEADVRVVSPGTWRTLLDHLDRVAVLVETKRMKVRVLGGERDVVCDPEGKTRCAYCRDGITGEEPDLVACERCRTVLHAACWEEHGSCPMLGCEGEAPERARVG